MVAGFLGDGNMTLKSQIEKPNPVNAGQTLKPHLIAAQKKTAARMSAVPM